MHAQHEEQTKATTKAASQKEEQMLAAKVALEKEVAQLRKKRKANELATDSTSSYRGNSDPDSEKLANLEALITCSTCREVNAFRSTIITKCMHSKSPLSYALSNIMLDADCSFSLAFYNNSFLQIMYRRPARNQTA